MVRCRLLGHRFRFSSEGSTMHWRCARDCGAAAQKRYPTAEEARRYALAFDRDARDDLGRRTPIGLLPLRLIRAARGRHKSA